MPTNLPPEYFQVEELYRAAIDPAEKVRLLEELISTIPKHKGTDHLRADLRRRLSKLKDSASQRKGGSHQVSPFQVDREGAGQVVVIGAPNTGKSSLVQALTNAEPEVAVYPFTTRVPLPGMMPYENIQIQLVDTPPLHQDNDERQFYALIRQADVIVLVIDLQGPAIQQFEDSFDLLISHFIVPDHVPEPLRERVAALETDRRRVVKPLVVLANKADDDAHDDDFEVLCELLGVEHGACPMVPASVATTRNLDRFKRMVYDALGIVRIYSKPPGKEPNLNSPFVMDAGGTLEDFAGKVHQDFVKNLKSARVWGGSADHDGQMVGRDHVLHDGDIVELKT